MPLEGTVEHLGAVQFEVNAREHTISCDQPPGDNLRIEIETPFELTDQHRAGVEKAVHHRMIQNRLLHPPQISTQVKQPEKALRG
jgi:hypothetical protein